MSGNIERLLHQSIIDAVGLLNITPEIARFPTARTAHEILRDALVKYADAYMDQPVTDDERAVVARKHRRAR